MDFDEMRRKQARAAASAESEKARKLEAAQPQFKSLADYITANLINDTENPVVVLPIKKDGTAGFSLGRYSNQYVNPEKPVLIGKKHNSIIAWLYDTSDRYKDSPYAVFSSDTAGFYRVVVDYKGDIDIRYPPAKSFSNFDEMADCVLMRTSRYLKTI